MDRVPDIGVFVTRRVLRGVGVWSWTVPRPAQLPQVAAARQARFAPVGQGCTCREVVLNAKNVVRDAEVRTGDAEVINTSITYVTPSYDDTEVEVEQDADAETGDAVAGQVLAVDGNGAGRGGGCSRVVVNATNIVEDAEVRSGDALARNTSVVLLDPAVQRGDVEVEVDQDADAESGDAIAGQVIGIKGGGGPCGGVILNALNEVRDVDVRSGDATIENISKVLACRDAGCLRTIRGLLGDVDSVNVCKRGGCESVGTDEFVHMLKRSFKDNKDADIFDDEDVDDEDDDGEPDDDDVFAEEDAESDDDGGRRKRKRDRGDSDEFDDVATDTAVEASPTPHPAQELR